MFISKLLSFDISFFVFVLRYPNLLNHSDFSERNSSVFIRLTLVVPINFFPYFIFCWICNAILRGLGIIV